MTADEMQYICKLFYIRKHKKLTEFRNGVSYFAHKNHQNIASGDFLVVYTKMK